MVKFEFGVSRQCGEQVFIFLNQRDDRCLTAAFQRTGLVSRYNGREVKMGVEFKQYVIPRQNSLRPMPEQLADLLAVLARDNWIPEASGAYVRTEDGRDRAPFSLKTDWFREYAERELLLSWPIENLAQSRLRYPFERLDHPQEETYYELQLH